MKKIKSIISLIIIVALLSVLAPKLIHKCSDCEKSFVGTGYEANVIAEVLTDDEQILCKECAEVHHAISLMAGKSLKEFKRGFFD